MSHSATLLLMEDGNLHLYCDEEHAQIIGSDLPVGQDLWGAVDVAGSCVQIKSEMLDPGNASKQTKYLTITVHVRQGLIIVLEPNEN